jgi:sigma-B regulation protein RsbU (phosphoserine phosphatase)
LPQEKIHEAGASKIAWSYLLVKIPEIPVEKGMMFLALSFYLADDDYAATPISTLYTPDDATLTAIKGKVGISNDWYVGAESGDTVMSAVIPLKNELGEVIAALGVDYLVGSFRERIAEQKFVSMIVFVVTVAIALVLIFFVTAWISIPLSKLRIGAEQLSKHDFEHRVDIKSNDEFGLLANTFNKVSEELGEFTRDLDSIVKAKTAGLTKAREEVVALNNILNQENAHLGAEVKNLIALRERTLPYLNQKLKVNNYEITFNYLPSQAVCGDFWQIRSDKECTDISFGGISGYGLETAMMAMQIQSLFKVVDGNNNKRLSAINDFLFEQGESINLKLLCKLFLLQINKNNITLSGSGEAPIRFSTNQQAFIKLASLLPLGVNRDITMESVQLSLHSGEGLLLYSAGFKLALAHLAKSEGYELQAQDILHLSGVLGESSGNIMDKFTEQPWFDDFNQDISFILINRKGS